MILAQNPGTPVPPPAVRQVTEARRPEGEIRAVNWVVVVVVGYEGVAGPLHHYFSQSPRGH